MKRFGVSIIIIAFVVLTGANHAYAGFLYHATKQAAAKKIARSGFSKAHMNQNSRFGKMGYASSRPKSALNERPSSDAVNRFKTTRNFKKHVMDTRKMNTAELKQAAGAKDMRGAVKNKVIGPKLAHNLAKQAGKNNQVIA